MRQDTSISAVSVAAGYFIDWEDNSRVPDEATLRCCIDANITERNGKPQPINWRFTIRDARNKLHRLYPSMAA